MWRPGGGGGGGRGAVRSSSSSNTDNRQLLRLTREVNAVHNRIQRRILECRLASEASGSLLDRARRLNERLEVLKHKLRFCFEMSHETAPSALTNGLHRVMQQMAELEPEDAPPDFICPITQCVMVDPVATADNKVYDRPAIQQWFANFPDGKAPTSPLTNLPLDDLTLRPVPELRAAIQAFLQAKLREASGDAPDGSPALAPPAASGGGPAAAPPAAPSRRDGPIWSSSVVPPTEPNSRALNFLRLADGIDVDIDAATSSLNVRGGRVGGVSAASSDNSTPIWSSSVVPPTEPNSRVLNMIRVDPRLPLPTMLPAAAPQPTSSQLPTRSRVASRAPVPSSGLYVLPSSPPRGIGAQLPHQRRRASANLDLNRRR